MPPRAPRRPRVIDRVHDLTLVAILALAASCATPRDPAPVPTSAPVAELNLLTLPTALNLDGQPGPDAVAVKVFAVPRGGARGAPLPAGRLAIAAYPGTHDDLPALAPFHTWVFPSADLAPYRFDAALGTGYSLVLSWAPKHLPGDRLTLVATFLPDPAGPAIDSPPAHVAAAVE